MLIDRIAATLETGGKVLLAGPPGSSKSTLAAALAARFRETGVPLGVIGCDPGSPAFGPPGAVCLGEWRGEALALLDHEPVCTLDAVRFRLPLVQAVSRLLMRAAPGPVLLDAPGTVRGVGGAELLAAVAAAAGVDLVTWLERPGRRLRYRAGACRARHSRASRARLR